MFMLLGKGYIVIRVAMIVAIPKWRLPGLSGLSGATAVKIISSLPITARTTHLFLDFIVYIGDINK